MKNLSKMVIIVLSVLVGGLFIFSLKLNKKIDSLKMVNESLINDNTYLADNMKKLSMNYTEVEGELVSLIDIHSKCVNDHNHLLEDNEALKKDISKLKEEKIVMEQQLNIASTNAGDIYYTCECAHSAWKSYERSFRITNNTTRSYRLLQQCDNRNGLLYYNGYLAVAMGSKYGPVGSLLTLNFNDGHTLDVIKLDEKADIHTINHCHNPNGELIEVIIDDTTFKMCHPYEYAMGNMATLPGLGGILTSAKSVGAVNV